VEKAGGACFVRDFARRAGCGRPEQLRRPAPSSINRSRIAASQPRLLFVSSSKKLHRVGTSAHQGLWEARRKAACDHFTCLKQIVDTFIRSQPVNYFRRGKASPNQTLLKSKTRHCFLSLQREPEPR
jgi:hypothetical protein